MQYDDSNNSLDIDKYHETITTIIPTNQQKLDSQSMKYELMKAIQTKIHRRLADG